MSLSDKDKSAWLTSCASVAQAKAFLANAPTLAANAASNAQKRFDAVTANNTSLHDKLIAAGATEDDLSKTR